MAEPRTRRRKAPEIVADWMRRQVIEGEIAEGELFPSEAALSEELGVSRPTIREAMRILESEGIVTIRRGADGGARARRPQVSAVARAAGFLLQDRRTQISDVYRCRKLLDEAALTLIMSDDALRTAAVEVLDETLAAERAALSGGQDTPIADGLFHRMLAEACGSPTLSLFASITNQLIHTHTRNYLSEHHDDTESATISTSAHRAHSRVVDLMRDGDAAGALALWIDHLDSSSELLIADDDVPVSLLDAPVDPRNAFF